jgi:F0F1-type ATP synthase membrane subunit b/b'
VITPPNLSLLLIMACFWLVFWLVYTQFLKPIGALLDQREKQIQSAAAVFTTAKDELDEAMTRCERELAQAATEGQKARGVLRGEGEAARRARLDEARQQGQQRLAALAAELDTATEEARAALRASSGDLAHALAERLVERRIAS